jgi:hypothetical protein
MEFRHGAAPQELHVGGHGNDAIRDAAGGQVRGTV